jgi:DNA repair and recombination protein RAD54B
VTPDRPVPLTTPRTPGPKRRDAGIATRPTSLSIPPTPGRAKDIDYSPERQETGRVDSEDREDGWEEVVHPEQEQQTRGHSEGFTEQSNSVALVEESLFVSSSEEGEIWHTSSASTDEREGETCDSLHVRASEARSGTKFKQRVGFAGTIISGKERSGQDRERGFIFSSPSLHASWAEDTPATSNEELQEAQQRKTEKSAHRPHRATSQTSVDGDNSLHHYPCKYPSCPDYGTDLASEAKPHSPSTASQPPHTQYYPPVVAETLSHTPCKYPDCEDYYSGDSEHSSDDAEFWTWEEHHEDDLDEVWDTGCWRPGELVRLLREAEPAPVDARREKYRRQRESLEVPRWAEDWHARGWRRRRVKEEIESDSDCELAKTEDDTAVVEEEVRLEDKKQVRPTKLLTNQEILDKRAKEDDDWEYWYGSDDGLEETYLIQRPKKVKEKRKGEQAYRASKAQTRAPLPPQRAAYLQYEQRSAAQVKARATQQQQQQQQRLVQPRSNDKRPTSQLSCHNTPGIHYWVNDSEMWNKPFKLPAFKPPSQRQAPPPSEEIERIAATPSPPGSPRTEQPYKRRKLLVRDVQPLPTARPQPHINNNAALTQPRKSLVDREKLEQRLENERRKEVEKPSGPEGYYLVVYRKPTAKKHKTWDDDGVLAVRNGVATLWNSDGRELAKKSCNEVLLPESMISLGGKEVMIEEVRSREDFMGGRLFSNGSKPRQEEPGPPQYMPPKPKELPKMNPLQPISAPKRQPSAASASSGGGRENAIVLEDDSDVPAREVRATSFYANKKFSTPVTGATNLPPRSDGVPTPKWDPNVPNAVVMKRPTDCPKGKQIVDVVVDPLLGNKLRPHQKEGVKFLYECVMGLRGDGAQGALLADEMGLGKTLQTITLIWTLLKQSPYFAPTRPGVAPPQGVIKKVLIACPATLVDNWKLEFRKWLGREKIGVMTLTDRKDKLTDFTHGRSYQVLIVSYDRIRQKDVREGLLKGAGVDMFVCDEAHRLKTEDNQARKALEELPAAMRVALSGTPLQNDLGEFYVLCSFINPGCLPKRSVFKSQFENVIERSRQPNASEREKELGEARQADILERTRHFILRRTAEVQSQFLPPKTEFVVFCQPTTAQSRLYQEILGSRACQDLLSGNGGGEQLALITMLRKCCNSPLQMMKAEDARDPSVKVAQEDEVSASLKAMAHADLLKTSSKMRVLDGILKSLITNKTGEKIVIVSNFTAMLDIIAKHLNTLSMPFSRLDGSTPTAQRSNIVDEFNKTPSHRLFALLLSSRAGGVGLNLVGASRLVLFDADWNPATDLQAMARVHRPGQTRHTFIYRLLCAGGLDEKIWQRQVVKLELAERIVDSRDSATSFTLEELRDLFTLDSEKEVGTHRTIGCTCGGKEKEIGVAAPSGRNEAETLNLPLNDEGDRIASKSSNEPEDSGFAISTPLTLSHAFEEEDDDDDDDDLPLDPTTRRRRKVTIPTTTMVKASSYDWRAVESQISATAAEQRKANMAGKMQSLLSYSHIDVSPLRNGGTDVFGGQTSLARAVERRIEDGILAGVLKDRGQKVAWVFKRGNAETGEWLREQQKVKALREEKEREEMGDGGGGRRSRARRRVVEELDEDYYLE